jgi:hypothetical protein
LGGNIPSKQGSVEMSLRDIPLDKISEEDINALILTGVPESPLIDYKRDTYGKKDDDKREFLADICSFANTMGGDIVIGVDESGGLPTAVTPIAGDIDAERRRLESMALNGIEPRLSNLHIQPIPVTNGHVLVVRVPRSFAPPHRVIATGINRFYARAGTQRYEPNVEQLRHLFNDAPRMVERIRSFQADRLMKIAAGDTPIPMGQFGKVVVHVVPLPSFADGRMADLLSRMDKGTHVPLPLDLIGFACAGGCNLEGFVNYAQVGEERNRSYAQFFRNGAIEGVGELRSDDDVGSRFLTVDLTNVVLSRVHQYIDVLKSYDLGLPIFVYLSLCNATRTVHRYAHPYGNFADTRPLGREVVACPEIYIDSFDSDLIEDMRPAFNTLWNAVGHLRCERYDDIGRWRASSPYAMNWGSY